MTNKPPSGLCPDNKLSPLLALAGDANLRGMRELDDVLKDYPSDPRLHFLRGSILAARQDYSGARASMRRAIDLAPDYAVARFQLGLLLLTSGEAYAAQEVWGPLHLLPSEQYLRSFVLGLCHLIRDEFAEAVRLLKEGISRNRENPAMNKDMQLIIDEIQRKLDAGTSAPAASSVDLLLQQAALKATRH